MMLEICKIRSNINLKICNINKKYEEFDDENCKLDDKIGRKYLNNISKILLKQSDLDKLKNGTLKKIYFMVCEQGYCFGDYLFTIYYKEGNFILTNDSKRRTDVDFEVLAKLIDTSDCSHASEYGMNKFNNILNEMPLLRTHDNKEIITYDWIQYQHWYGGEADPQDSGISYEEADNEWWWGEYKENYINKVIPIKEDDIDKKYNSFPNFEKSKNSWGHGGANHYHGKRSLRAINDYLHERSENVNLSKNISFNLFESLNISEENLEIFKEDKLIFFDTLYNDAYDDPYIVKLVEVTDNNEEINNIDIYKKFLNDFQNRLNTIDTDIKKFKDDNLMSWYNNISEIFNEYNRKKLYQFFMDRENKNLIHFIKNNITSVYKSTFDIVGLPDNYYFEKIEFENKQFFENNPNLLRLVLNYLNWPNPNEITNLELENLKKLEKLANDFALNDTFIYSLEDD